MRNGGGSSDKKAIKSEDNSQYDRIRSSFWRNELVMTGNKLDGNCETDDMNA